MKSTLKLATSACAALMLLGCEAARDSGQGAESAGAASTENADQFVARVNAESAELSLESGAAAWVRATYITQDTAILAAKAQERVLKYLRDAVDQSKRFEGTEMSEASARAIKLLKLGTSMPAPKDAEKLKRLSEVATKMEGDYGSAKYCRSDDDCLDETALIRIMANENSSYDELLEAWTGWRDQAKPMRADYEEFASLVNEGAQELGFTDLGVMWRSGYDMSPEEFNEEAERLWTQVKPLYDELHCYVRERLVRKYGTDRVPENGPIPAHLLGNMWAQQWGNIYDLVEPFPGVGQFDVDAALEEQDYSPVRMTETAENFFVSLGMQKLPETFWERSLLEKPRDRDVVCHASAWPLEGGNDVRIKQCVEPTEEHLITLHHELGHVYYFLLYKDQPFLFQDGANDGFHEGIGDTLQLSMTPAYLREIGLIGDVEQSDEAAVNQLMKLALDKIAFLPFGKLVDQWRWQVFSGEIKPAHYNEGWWALRTKYQGIAPPVERSEDDFDPGAKYHIPGNTPYTRYFLAHILQFQFHRALCDAAGFEGPLHECSIYGSEEAGNRLSAMLAMGASRPWPDALEKITGSREMDATAIIDYFAPLMTWLEAQNEGKSCGW